MANARVMSYEVSRRPPLPQEAVKHNKAWEFSVERLQTRRTTVGKTFVCAQVWLGLGALVLTPTAFAQEAGQTAPNDDDGLNLVQEDPAWSIHLDLAASHAFDSDIDDGPDVAVTRASAKLTFDTAINDDIDFTLGIEEEFSFYNFDGDLMGVAGEPLDNALAVTISPRATFRVDETWSWFVGGQISFAGETGADTGKSFTGGALAGAIYRVNDNLTWTFGALVVSRLEDDPLVIPLVGVIWRLDNDVRLEVVGPEAALIAQINDAWSVALKGSWSRREFRLDDSGAAPDGVFIDERVRIGVEAVWQPNSAVDIGFEIGTIAYSEYEVLSDSGGSLFEENGSPAVYAAVRARISF